MKEPTQNGLMLETPRHPVVESLGTVFLHKTVRLVSEEGSNRTLISYASRGASEPLQRSLGLI